jgi:hypothetical protein
MLLSTFSFLYSQETRLSDIYFFDYLCLKELLSFENLYSPPPNEVNSVSL